MSELYQSLSHSKWDCKYHVVFVPKRRRKAIFGQAHRQLGVVFHALARRAAACRPRVLIDIDAIVVHTAAVIDTVVVARPAL